MDELKAFLQLDWVTVIVTLFLIVSVVTWSFEALSKFSVIVGKPLKWIRKSNIAQEELKKTIDTVHELDAKYESISSRIDDICSKLEQIQETENRSKLKELKDKLVQYYNTYTPKGCWTALESDAFWDLFNEYEQRGGDGYIHTVVEPAMRSLKVID